MKPSEGFGAYFQEQIDDKKADIDSVVVWCAIFTVFIMLSISFNSWITNSTIKEQITQQKETNIQLQHINQKLHMLTVDKSVDRLRVVGP